MKNTMKLNALGILVALTVAGQAEAGVGSWFGRGPKAPQLPKVTITPKAEASSGKAEYLMAGLSAFGGQALAGVKAGASWTAKKAVVAKTAGVAFAKTGTAKFAALPVAAKVTAAIAAAGVTAYGAHKLYKRMTAPKAPKAPEAPKAPQATKPGMLARAKAQVVALKDAVVARVKSPFAGANVDAKKAADAKAAQIAADAKKAQELQAQQVADAKKAAEARKAKARTDYFERIKTVNPNGDAECQRLAAIFNS
jgi:hypothetical protein